MDGRTLTEETSKKYCPGGNELDILDLLIYINLTWFL